MALILHDESGYRTELVCGYAPHSVQPEDVIHGRIKDRKMWEDSSSDPSTLGVVTDGTRITVLVYGREVFSFEDSTYQVGAAGMFGMGLATILHYALEGTPAESEPWREVDEEKLFFYPVPEDAVAGYDVFAQLTRSDDGEIIMTFCQGGARPAGSMGCEGPLGIAFTTSRDQGRTWSQPTIAYRREGTRATALSLHTRTDSGLWFDVRYRSCPVSSMRRAGPFCSSPRTGEGPGLNRVG